MIKFSFDLLVLVFEVLGLGVKVLGLGFGVLGLGLEVLGLGFVVLGLGFEDFGLGFEGLGLGFEVSGQVAVDVPVREFLKKQLIKTDMKTSRFYDQQRICLALAPKVVWVPPNLVIYGLSRCSRPRPCLGFEALELGCEGLELGFKVSGLGFDGLGLGFDCPAQGGTACNSLKALFS